MKIEHSLVDLGYRGDDYEQIVKDILKDYTQDYCSFKISFSDGTVVIEIDDTVYSQAKSNYLKAIKLCETGEYIKAKDILQNVISQFPLNTDALRSLAQIEYMQKDIKNAIIHAEQAYRSNTKDINTLLLLGNLWLISGDVKMSEAYFLSVLNFDPLNVRALNNLASVAFRKSEYSVAERYCKQVMELDSSLLSSYYICSMIKEKQLDKKSAFSFAMQGISAGTEKPENPGVKDKLVQHALKIASNVIHEIDCWNTIEKCSSLLSSQSGHGIEYIRDTSLSVFAKLQYWKLYNREKSIILFNDTKQYCEHLIMHELMHLRMMQNATALGKGKVISSNIELKKAFAKRFATGFKKVGGMLSGIELDDFIYSIYDNLVSRIMNAPLDLFVESMLFRDYSDLRPLFMLSLNNQEKEYCASDVLDITNVLPSEIVSVSRITNTVQSMLMKDLYGLNFVNQHGISQRDMVTAKILYSQFKDAWDNYEPGCEYELLLIYINRLNMEGLFKILDEDDFVKSL